MRTSIIACLHASILCLVFVSGVSAQTHTLTVETQGDGSGIVRDCHSASECPGERIDCGLFLDGESVLLKALPDKRSAFEGWLVNGETSVSQDLEMTQDVVVTVVFTRKIDREPPVVTLHLDREYVLPGESVMMTTTAADNVGIATFELRVNGEGIATAPGSATYTLPAVGAYEITATAKDAEGNSATATRWCYARGDAMTVSLFEGVDVERGISHRDVNYVVLTPGDMDAVRTIVRPPEADAFAFPAEADFFFSYRDRQLMFVPTNAVEIAVLKHTPYETVSAETLSDAMFLRHGDGVVVEPTDTVLLKTAEHGYAKAGAFHTNAVEWTI